MIKYARIGAFVLVQHNTFSICNFWSFLLSSACLVVECVYTFELFI